MYNLLYTPNQPLLDEKVFANFTFRTDGIRMPYPKFVNTLKKCLLS